MWFGVKMLLRSTVEGAPGAPDLTAASLTGAKVVDSLRFDPSRTLIEERVIIVCEEDAGAAMKRAEELAVQYAVDRTYPNLYGQRIVCTSLGAFDVFSIGDEPQAGVEVYSSMSYSPREQPDAEIVRQRMPDPSESDEHVFFEPNFSAIKKKL